MNASNPERMKEAADEAVKRIEEASKGTHERLAKLEKQRSDLEKRVDKLEQEPETIFGAWTPVSVNVAYQAPSDGFLVAYGHTLSTGGFTLDTGTSEEELNREQGGQCAPLESVRSRAAGYQGATTPIKKDHFYKVRLCDGELIHITAYWLSVNK